MRVVKRSLLVLASLLLPAAACSSSSSSSTVAASADAAGTDAASPTRGDFDPAPFGGDRPAQLYVPSGYSDATATPLLVLLHGYSASGAVQDLYLGLRQHAESRGFLYIFPDGTVDKAGNHFWNATDACCDFDGTHVDDSSYVSALIKEVGTRYKVDPKRVFLVGHSNGAFMSYRMSCDHADQIAAMVGIAGATWLDPGKCKPAAPVAVLQVHGTADTEVLYDGAASLGTLPGNGGYPSAKVTMSTWAGYDGCATTLDTSAPNLDLDDTIAGNETSVSKYASGCKSGSAVELWSIAGGKHLPNFSTSFDPKMLDWLFAHPKP
jgi:polyhydroxybutyrate depolymerase